MNELLNYTDKFDERIIGFADEYTDIISSSLRIEITESEIRYIKLMLLMFLDVCVTSISPITKET